MMNNNKANNVLLIVATIIMALMMGVMFFQNKTLNKYKDLLEKTDTTTTMTVDTLYLEKEIKDTVPQYITQTIFKTDTVYKKEGDSISATPLIITLKKKKWVEL
jgi:regulatory protein YycI of two-component signal transduction system YycFG